MSNTKNTEAQMIEELERTEVTFANKLEDSAFNAVCPVSVKTLKKESSYIDMLIHDLEMEAHNKGEFFLI